MKNLLITARRLAHRGWQASLLGCATASVSALIWPTMSLNRPYTSPTAAMAEPVQPHARPEPAIRARPAVLPAKTSQTAIAERIEAGGPDDSPAREEEPLNLPPRARPTAAPTAVEGFRAPDAETNNQPPMHAPGKLGFVWHGGNLREGPGLEYPVVGGVDAGDLVEVLAEQDSWWHVRAADAEGWLSSELVIVEDDATEEVPGEEEAIVSDAEEFAEGIDMIAALVTASGSLRAGPGRQFPVIGEAEVGTLLELLGSSGDWWQVRIGLSSGWVDGALLYVPPEAFERWPKPTPVPPTPRPARPQAAKPAPARPAPPKDIAPPASGAPAVAELPAAPVTSVERDQAAVPIPPGQPVVEESSRLLPPPAVSESAARVAAARPVAPAPRESLWPVAVVPGRINRLPDVVAPRPFLVADVVRPFLRARTRVYMASGVDYLGVLGEAFRNVDFETRKPGVARQSWHKAGRAIDLAQSRMVNGVQGVVFVRDSSELGLYRVLIRCAKQDGSLGVYYPRERLPRGRHPGYYVDVTAILVSEGFQRIPPVGEVSEAWHYEFRGGLTWRAAMQQLYNPRTLRSLYPEMWR